jgi:hypothetical protein
LKDVKVFCRLTHMRHALNRSRTRTNNCNPLVGEFMQVAARIAAGLVVVPTAGMKSVAFEFFDAGDPG